MNNNQFNQAFIEEALEFAGIIEKNILLLEKSPDNAELINEIFRSLHTIKGSGSMLGFDDISELTHIIETIFDKIRKDDLKITQQIITATLNYCDSLKILLTSEDENEKQLELDKLKKILISLNPENPGKPANSKLATKANEISKRIFRIYFQPSSKTIKRAHDPGLIIRDLGRLGLCKFYVHTENLPELDNFNVYESYFAWTCILITEKSENEVKDVFKFVMHDSKISINLIDESDIDEDLNYKRIGEILVHNNKISNDAIEELLNQKQPIGELALEKGLITRSELETALLEQTIVRKERQKRSQINENVTIRVNNDKLDELVNLVGELVTLEAQLKQFSGSLQIPELNGISDRLNRLIGELRENTLNLRMVPLNRIFNAFTRLVRDLSIQENKEINLNISGGDTEVDKNVIESLKDPLLHIIRNCVDHGIENSDEREKLGKNKQGEININAQYSGAYVTISISDDGRGLSLEKIREKAIKLNMIQADEKLSNKQIMHLIFKPGFTTSSEVSKISGRGVGMDVVKKNIEKLRGFIEVTSQPGKGSRFYIKIPLTLAIIDGLLFQVGDSNFIINLSSVEECLDFTPELKNHSESDVINYRDRVIPYTDIRELFGIQGNRPEVQQIIVARATDKVIALKVDKALRKHQTVIKSVSQVYNNIEEVSGATILGNGRIALILDTSKIAENIEKKLVGVDE